MADNLIESEAEQIRRFNALQKVALGILAKWKGLILLTFVVSYFFALAFLVWHSAKSVHRFSAETKLLYAPRRIEGFGSMDNKQLMSVLDRRSLKRKIGDHFHFSSESQRLRRHPPQGVCGLPHAGS